MSLAPEAPEDPPHPAAAPVAHEADLFGPDDSPAAPGARPARARHDRAEVERLLAELRPRIHRFVLARLVDRDLAEDVTQEVLMTLLATLARCDEVRGPVTGWAFGIAVRKVSEAHRSLRRRPEDSVDDVPARPSTHHLDDPERTAVHLDNSRRLARMLAALPGAQGDIIRLRIAAGLTAEETAAALGLTAGAVRVAQHRALAKLRQMMQSGAAGGPDGATR